jgi:hypothetical protein
VIGWLLDMSGALMGGYGSQYTVDMVIVLGLLALVVEVLLGLVNLMVAVRV